MSAHSGLISCLIFLQIVACKSTQSTESREASARHEDTFYTLENRLNARLPLSQVDKFIQDLNSASLTERQLSALLQAALNPRNPLVSVRRIIEALRARGGDLNHPFYENSSAGDPTFVCKALSGQLEDHFFTKRMLTKYRAMLFHGADTPTEAEDVMTSLNCDGPLVSHASRNGVYVACLDGSNSLRPSCPDSWQEYRNAPYTGCQKGITPPTDRLEELEADFKSRCNGVFSASDSTSVLSHETMTCRTFKPEPPLPCPASFVMKTIDRSKYRFAKDAPTSQPLFGSQCIRNEEWTVPGQDIEPHATKLQELEANADAVASALTDSIRKARYAGSDLDQKCRNYEESYESLAEELENRGLVREEPTTDQAVLADSDDVVGSQLFRIRLGQNDWMMKVFIAGRCKATVVHARIAAALDKVKLFKSTEDILLSEVREKCGLESIRVINSSNSAYYNLLHEVPEMFWLRKPISMEEVLAKF